MNVGKNAYNSALYFSLYLELQSSIPHQHHRWPHSQKFVSLRKILACFLWQIVKIFFDHFQRIQQWWIKQRELTTHALMQFTENEIPSVSHLAKNFVHTIHNSYFCLIKKRTFCLLTWSRRRKGSKAGKKKKKCVFWFYDAAAFLRSEQWGAIFLPLPSQTQQQHQNRKTTHMADFH